MPGTDEASRDGATGAVKRQIFTATREAIVSRQLPPGTKLTEDVIADTFGCGRGPVRWALARLGDEGLVTLVPHRGAFVAQPPLDEAKHLFGARRMLEGGIVRCLCEERHSAGFAPLIACADAEDRAHQEGDETAALPAIGRLPPHHGRPHRQSHRGQHAAGTRVPHDPGDFGPPAPGFVGAAELTNTVGLIDLMMAGDAERAAREMEEHLTALEAGLDLAPQPRVGTSLRSVLQGAMTATAS